MKKILLLILALVLASAAGTAIFLNINSNKSADSGRSRQPFVAARGSVRLRSPLPNDTVGNFFEINGEAKGSWFFEASFPVLLVDKDDRQLGQAPAEALGNWMTEDYVPFRAAMKLSDGIAAVGERARLILSKSNPSGQPENDEKVEIPVVLSGGREDPGP